MAEKYNPKEIEGKWQKYWEENELFRAEDLSDKPKRYVLDMFPYPSGAGLHVGHPEGYTATDIYSRYLRMNGFNVLHPMGWDAFGLPAENYAIKTGTHPRITTEQNINTFRRQIKALGFSYDWSREIDTTDPKYYKWTQWIFLQLFKRGLAYEAVVPINWCPSCKTGLANEEVEGGKCLRCGTSIERKNLRQWMLKITAYADRLLNNLDKLDWSESIKALQRNWIGRSEGASVQFQIKNYELQIEVYTTRPDTLFGATYMVLAPEHSLIQELKDKIENFTEVENYINEAKNKSDLERTDLAKTKTGVELKGIKAINPVNNKEIPIWISDYVLATYGTGAIMAVPAHDDRDFEFAKKFDLEIIEVIAVLTETRQGADAIRDDKETIKRETVYAFVKHWSEDKYLCLDWAKYNWHSAIIGGIDDGEDFVDAGMREIREETGYQNIKLVKKFNTQIDNHFFAGHKDVNRYSMGHFALYQLENDEWIEPNPEDVRHHEAVWIDANQVGNFLNLEGNKIMWQMIETDNDCFAGEGVAMNSGFLDGLSTVEAKEKMFAWLEEKGIGKKTINYKLRDWVFSRQRYWGEPIPLIHCPACAIVSAQGFGESKKASADKENAGVVPVPENELPLLLPEVEKYEPSGTGESPLATIDEWVNTTCPVCGGPANRETNTMPQWAGSSWYFLRYIDPHNDEALADKEKMKYWLPVDLYLGGAEHAVLHLLYARFWNMVLFDMGVVPVEEPFAKLVNQGMILGEDGEKMSKSRGNVINPDDILKEFGADAFRLYEMFMGPLEDAKPWSTKGMVGVVRFLEKIWNIFSFCHSESPLHEDKLHEAESRNLFIQITNEADKDLEILMHKTIKKVTEDTQNMRFNTAISQMMILSNLIVEKKVVTRGILENWLKLLSPFAPHLAEELWHQLGHATNISQESWPEYDESKIKDEVKEFVVQINGKVRARLQLPAEISQDEAVALAKQNIQVQKYLEGQEIKKVIFVPGKLIGFVI